MRAHNVEERPVFLNAFRIIAIEGSREPLQSWQKIILVQAVAVIRQERIIYVEATGIKAEHRFLVERLAVCVGTTGSARNRTISDR
jgi:hypothetical protein